MDEIEGDLNCEHEWVHDNCVILTYPSINHKICSKCGRLEHEQIKEQESETFHDIRERFKNLKNKKGEK